MLASKRKSYSILTIIGIIVFIIVLDLFGVFGIFKSIVIRGFGNDYSPTSYINKSFNKIISLYVSIDDLDAENKRLVKENKTLRKDSLDCRDIENENDELRNSLLIPGIEETETELVQIYTNPLFGNQGDFFINKGSNHNIKEGFVLIDSGSHYVGKISEVNRLHSKGVFASHWYPELPVRIAGKDIKGIVKADQNGWQLDMIPTDADIQKKDIVLLDGDEDLLRSGNVDLNIIIGQVSEIINEEKDIFTKGVVDPLVNYKEIDKAFVLLEKE